jgi:hypothetical protein
MRLMCREINCQDRQKQSWRIFLFVIREEVATLQLGEGARLRPHYKTPWDETLGIDICRISSRTEGVLPSNREESHGPAAN